MKLLVFAHTPPPHHGQSYMVQLMLEGFGGDRRKGAKQSSSGNAYGIDCYHVNARLSQGIHEIGGLKWRKLFLLVGYCMQAIWCRFRYGVTKFYYVPAPSQRGALLRDWVVMLLCRPFFKRIIFHWHAAGLTEWLNHSASSFTRGVSQCLLGRPDLSIVLSQFNITDGQRLSSRRVEIVHNGIPDPCPNFASEVLPRRQARFLVRQKLVAGEKLSSAEIQNAGRDPHIVQLLYLAHCSREKGLFDAVEAVALANAKGVGSGSPLRFQLTVAGEFVEPELKRDLEERISMADLQIQNLELQGAEPSSLAAVRYAGFLHEEAKHRALTESDCLLFPSYFHAESFGLAVIEAMAYGLPVVATRWRSVPELFPRDYPGLVPIKSPTEIARVVEVLTLEKPGEGLRNHFRSNFNLSSHLNRLADAMRL